MRRVGFIGLGAMGAPMAERLRQKGLLGCVYNRTRSKTAAFESKGVYIADSPADLARRCDVILCIVSDDTALRSVMLGPKGALRSFAPGGIVLEMSTTSIGALVEVAEEAKKRGIEVLDAPVSGIPTDAEKGDLTALVGGRPQALETCRDVLKPIAKAVLHVGGIGAGRQIKFANNMLVAINLMGALEVTSFVQRTALDPQRFVKAIMQSRGNSWAFSRFIPGLVSGSSEHHKFTLSKDLDLALGLASEVGATTPFTALAKDFLGAAASKTRGQHGQAVTLDSLVEVFESLSDGKTAGKVTTQRPRKSGGSRRKRRT